MEKNQDQISHDKTDASHLNEEEINEIRTNIERNQSGMTLNELDKMHLEFTDEYIEKIRHELEKLVIAYKSLQQEEMQQIVDEITRESMKFRAMINKSSAGNAYYVISTEE